MKKYYIIPGFVQSISDGQSHWISGYRLMRLHNLDPKECVIVDPEDRTQRIPEGVTFIHPRKDGVYIFGKKSY